MTGQPRHDLFQRSGNGAGGYGGAVDQQDRQAKAAGGVEFGLRTRAARVLGDDMGDGVFAQKCRVGGKVKRAFGDDDGRAGQGERGFGFVDKAQQVVVLRFSGKGVEGLFADGKKDAGGLVGQGRCGGPGRGNMGPAVGGRGGPRGAFEGQKRGLRLRAGGYGVRAYLCGEGVGGVDHMGDAFGLQVTGKTFGAAKASGAGWQGLGNGRVGASGVGKDGIKALRGEGAGQKAGFGRAAEKKDARHG